jgi:hypothetical protein
MEIASISYGLPKDVIPDFHRLRQSAIGGLPGTIDEDGWRVLQSFEKVIGNVATNHGCIINQNMHDNQPQFGYRPTGAR